MSTGTIVEKIAAAIPGDNPAGIDTQADSRRDGPYRLIKDAQLEARRIEKKAIEEGENPKLALPQWNIVKGVGLETLEMHSKDLDIASYVIEAVVRTDGFTGLAEALQWTRLMVENFWDKLYPLPDSDEGTVATPEDLVNARIQPLSRLSDMGLLSSPLSWIEITKGTAGPYVFWNYDQAVEFDKCSDKEKEIRAKRGTVTKAQFDAASAETDVPFYQQLLKGIEDCQANFKSLIDAVTKKCKQTVPNNPPFPSYSKVQEDLEKCLSVVRHMTKGRLPEPGQGGTNKPAEAGAPGAQGGPAGPAIDNVLRTREDAFRALSLVAEFFERAEPQSLIPAQIKKVIRQGKMSPAEYFTELIEEEKLRQQIFKVYGLEQKSKAGDKGEK